MHDQPKYIPLRESAFFSDARSARALVVGTVARGQLHEDAHLYTGKVDGTYTATFPLLMTSKKWPTGAFRSRSS